MLIKKNAFFKRLFFCWAVIIAVAGFSVTAADAAVGISSQVRLTNSFDENWLFFKGDAQNAANAGFDDATWRKLNVPHDWSIEGTFDEKNPTGGAGGFLPGGVGWYRKHFTVPNAMNNRRVFIEFDGVMANSDVWINGVHLEKRPYGYVSFGYELTDYIQSESGKDNIIAVRADNSGQPASRWYTGAGIYRHVRLVVTDAVHIKQWGTFVSTPQISENQATVKVRSEVVNQANTPQTVSLEISLVAPNGKIVQTTETNSQTIEPGKTFDFEKQMTVKNPIRWDISNPVLYQAIVNTAVSR